MACAPGGINGLGSLPACVDRFSAGRACRTWRVASFPASAREDGGRLGGRPPCSHCLLFLGEEHVGVVAAVREHEVGHVVTVIAPGEVVV
jgi:hypothetical protein